MKKLATFLLLAVIAGGAIWYESRPTTVKIPVETSDTIVYDDSDYHLDTTTTTEVTQTTEAQRPDVNFDVPDVTMEVKGTGGDTVRIREVMGEPAKLDDLPEDLKAVAMGCPNVTDRDMVVQVDAKVELTSSLAAKVNVDYGILGEPAVFEYSSGKTCSEGNVNHDLHPGNYSHLTYWVVLKGAITPDHPDGDLDGMSWTLANLNVTLPNAETYYWSLWGPRVIDCTGNLMGSAEIWLAGASPQQDRSGCKAAATPATAAGTM